MPVVAVETRNMPVQEWLEARTRGIGGSDAAVVLGLSRYKTPFELWLEKTGQVTPQSSTSDAAYFGTLLEDLVAKEFEKRSGKKVRKRNAMFQHPNHEFILANIDRFVVGEKAILECKTASAFLAKEWENEEIPEAYIVQMQHYLGVLGPEYKKGYFAVLIGGQKFIWKEIERDDELIEMIFQAEIDFWNNHVLANQPPALDGSSAAEQFLAERFAKAEGEKSVNLKAEFKDKIERWHELKALIKELENEKNEIENQIKYELKDATYGLVGGYRAEWKQFTQNRVDSKKLKAEFPEIYEKVIKPTSYRKFAINQL
ncbi:lambda-exonuclease family protein [Geobacillus stearothermophilus]|nr:YqaJ viral recombinase family protein [Geobacillus stearothermophilus]